MKTIIPILDFDQGGFLTEPLDMVGYLTKFIMTNPGDTTLFIESQMKSIGHLLKSMEDDHDMVASSINTILTEEVGVKCELPYRFDVKSKKVSDTEVQLVVSITDKAGQLIGVNRFVKALMGD